MTPAAEDVPPPRRRQVLDINVVYPEEAIERTPCPVCGEMISPRARRCVKCSSDLGIWRWMTIGPLTLALLTALTSVIATSIAPLEHLMRTQEKELVLYYMGFGTGQPRGDVTLLLKNPTLKYAAVTASWAATANFFGLPHLM